jgi:tRNA pseudouridine65 synthase
MTNSAAGLISILHQDEDIVAVHKPSGFHVHPPELDQYRVKRDKIMLYVLKYQIKQKLYPVHRLDVGTSGVLLFALNSKTAGAMQMQIKEKAWQKTYHAVVRGWMPAEGEIDLPLELDSTGDLAESLTRYKTLSQIEIDSPVGKRFSKARYSLLEVSPITGRYHQIRRHLQRLSHPVVGDAQHGDSHHNRFFREQLFISGLCLRATSLQIQWRGSELRLQSEHDGKWQKIFQLFNISSNLPSSSSALRSV